VRPFGIEVADWNRIAGRRQEAKWPPQLLGTQRSGRNIAMGFRLLDIPRGLEKKGYARLMFWKGEMVIQRKDIRRLWGA
jgi:hypothetical protein